MAQLGAGTGTGFPTSIDTATTEVNAPAAGKTKARAEVINDMLAAIVAIETAITATTATATPAASKIPIADGSGTLNSWVTSPAITWTTPAFSAGDFTASGSMTWTVAAGDVATYEYAILGKLMIVNFRINTSSVGGTPSAELRIAIPASKVAAKAMIVPIVAVNAGTQLSTAIAGIVATGTYISCYTNWAGTAWSAATDTTYVIGSIAFEIQ